MTRSEPRNPFYLLLLLASLVFVITALAYAVVPTLEQKAIEAGRTPPPSPWRDSLRANGWRWLLLEVPIIIVFAVLSMVLDRLRSLKKEQHAATIPRLDEESSSSDNRKEG